MCAGNCRYEWHPSLNRQAMGHCVPRDACEGEHGWRWARSIVWQCKAEFASLEHCPRRLSALPHVPPLTLRLWPLSAQNVQQLQVG